MLDKERLANVLEEKLEEGYEVIRNMTVADREFPNACCSMFDIERTIKQLREYLKFSNLEIAQGRLKISLGKKLCMCMCMHIYNIFGRKYLDYLGN